MFKLQILIFIIIFVHDSSCVLDTLYGIAKQVQKYYLLLDDVDLNNPYGLTEFDDNPLYELLDDQLGRIYDEFNEMENSMNPKVILSLANKFNSRPLVMKALDMINLYILDIDSEYKKFHDCVVRKEFENLTESFHQDIETNILMIRDIMTDSRKIIVNEPNLVTAIIHAVTLQSDEMCGASQLVSEVLIHLFRMVMIAEIKSQVMLGFSYKYHYSNDEEWKGMNSMINSLYQSYFAIYVNIMIENLEVALNLYLRACDPEHGNWILNENYFEFKGTVRAMIFRYYLKDCYSSTCDIVGFEIANRECDISYYENWDECINMPTDCMNLGSTKSCISTSKQLYYMNSKVLGFFGKNLQCPNDTAIITDDDYNLNYQRSSCSCDCYGNSSKISLSFMKSRVGINRVITGLRFIRKNDTLHIQIKEGLLGAEAYINSSKITNKWLPIPDKIDPSQIHSIDKENRIFFLDDLRLPHGYVLTGIKFDKVTRGIITGFAITISGYPFNYTTGELSLKKELEFSIPMYIESQPLSFKSINPIGIVVQQKPSSGYLKYIKLQRSLLDEDFGQSTLPLFDGVPITTQPPSPLDGIGIFHKSISGYAGFISLRLHGLKYKEYFENFKLTHIIDDTVIFN